MHVPDTTCSPIASQRSTIPRMRGVSLMATPHNVSGESSGWDCMSTDTDRQEPVGPDRPSGGGVATGRRRLLRGGLSATPVIMTLASGRVSAGLCTTGSAYGSLNASGKQLSIVCSGRSPETWITTPGGHWPLNTSTLFQACFTPALVGTNISLKDVIDPAKGYDPVARHCVAALLNASTSPPLTPPAILGVTYAKAIWTSYGSKGFFEPTAGVQWLSLTIVDFIKTTYA